MYSFEEFLEFHLEKCETHQVQGTDVIGQKDKVSPRKIVPTPEDKVSHGDTQKKKNLPKAVSQTPLGKNITSVGICLKISNVESKTLRNCGLDNIVVYWIKMAFLMSLNYSQNAICLTKTSYSL